MTSSRSASKDENGLPSDPLLIGLKKRRPVRFDIPTQEFDTQVFAWIDDDKNLQVGMLVIGEDGKCKGGFTFVLAAASKARLLGPFVAMGLTNNMPAAYRVFQMFERAPAANPEVLGSAMTAVVGQLNPNGAPPFGEVAATVGEIVSADELKAILTGQLPSSFTDLCVKVVAQGAELDLDSLTTEADAGRLEYDERLQKLGVEKPGDLRLRLEGRDCYLNGFDPVRAAFASFSPQAAIVADCPFIGSNLLQARARGLDRQPWMAFGLAVIAAGNEVAKLVDTIDDSAFGRDAMIDGLTGADILKTYAFTVSRFISKHYAVGSPQSVANELLAKWREWEMIPVDTSLL